MGSSIPNARPVEAAPARRRDGPACTQRQRRRSLRSLDCAEAEGRAGPPNRWRRSCGRWPSASRAGRSTRASRARILEALGVRVTSPAQCWLWQAIPPLPSQGPVRSTQSPSFPGAKKAGLAHERAGGHRLAALRGLARTRPTAAHGQGDSDQESAHPVATLTLQRAVDQHGQEQRRTPVRLPCVVRTALDHDLTRLQACLAAFQD
jgi:hypothetical protein